MTTSRVVDALADPEKRDATRDAKACKRSTEENLEIVRGMWETRIAAYKGE